MYPYAGRENVNSNLSLHFSGEYNHIHWSDFGEDIVMEKNNNNNSNLKCSKGV